MRERKRRLNILAISILLTSLLMRKIRTRSLYCIGHLGRRLQGSGRGLMTSICQSIQQDGVINFLANPRFWKTRSIQITGHFSSNSSGLIRWKRIRQFKRSTLWFWKGRGISGITMEGRTIKSLVPWLNNLHKFMKVRMQNYFLSERSWERLFMISFNARQFTSRGLWCTDTSDAGTFSETSQIWLIPTSQLSCWFG